MSYKIDIPRMSIPFAFHSYMSIKETITASNHNTVTNHSKDVLFRHTDVFPIPSPSTAGTHCPCATCITQRKCRARPLSKRKKATRERRTEPRATRCCESLRPGSSFFSMLRSPTTQPKQITKIRYRPITKANQSLPQLLRDPTCHSKRTKV